MHSALTAASSHVRWRGLRHQLVGLDQGEIGQAAEVGLEPPDPLIVREHRVVVRARALVVDVVAVDGDPVAGLPVAHGRPGPQHHTRGVRADDVVVERVAAPHADLLAQPVEEAEGRERLEDRRPHRVEVDRAGHDRHVGLVGCELGEWDLADLQRFPRVFVRAVESVEHRDVRRAARTRPGTARAAGATAISSPDAPDSIAERKSCMGPEDSPPVALAGASTATSVRWTRGHPL